MTFSVLPSRKTQPPAGSALPGPRSPTGPPSPSVPAAADPSGSADRSLLRERRFLRFWLSQTISMVGSQVGYLAIPLVAVLILGAGAFQTGALTASSRLPFLVFGLLVGVLADRYRRRPMLIWTYLVRALALLWIPVAAALDILSMAQLYVVAFVIGSLTLLSDIAAQSLLPSLAPERRIIDANSNLEVSRSSTDLIGPSIAGGLIQAVTAPFALLLDVVTYLVATVLLIVTPIREELPARDKAQPSMLADIREGLGFVLRHHLLRWNALTSAFSNLFTNMLLAVLLLYAVRGLNLNPGTIGVVFAIGSVGALAGAASGQRLATRFGMGPTLIVSNSVIGCGALLLALATGPQPVRLIWTTVAYTVFCFGYPACNVAVISLRQLLAPGHLLGRTNATMRFLTWGTMPLGAFAGGVSGTWLGLRSTMIVAGAGLLLPPVLLLISPLRRVRDSTSVEALPKARPLPAHRASRGPIQEPVRAADRYRNRAPRSHRRTVFYAPHSQS